MFDATKLPTTPSQPPAGDAAGATPQSATVASQGGSKLPSYPARNMVLEGGRYRVVELEK